MPTIPEHELRRRHQAVLAAADPPPDAWLVVQRVDLYYLTGTAQQGHLILPREGEPRLLVRRVEERARSDSPLADVRPLSRLAGLRDELRAVCGPPPWRIAMELDVLPFAMWTRYREVLGKDAEIVDGAPAILAARAVKSEWEVERFREAASIHRLLFADVPEGLEMGLSTYELQKWLDWRACRHGHCGVSRLRGLDVECPIGLVVSGPDGALPGHSMFPVGGRGPHPWEPHGGSRSPIRPGDPVMVDYLASASGYHLDCSRTAVIGTLPDAAHAILDEMRAVERYVVSRLRPGEVPSSIWEGVRERIRLRGLDDGFMGPGRYAIPFVGHSVGLEVNETPVLAAKFDRPLVEGHVIAVEPKYTHPDWGVIGVEDTYVVRRGGAERLTTVPDELIRAAPDAGAHRETTE